MTEETKQELLQFDTMQIMEMIPHRYPFCLLTELQNVFRVNMPKAIKT